MNTIQELQKKQNEIQAKYKGIQEEFRKEQEKTEKALKALEVDYIKIDGKIELLKELENNK